jgi:cytochrome c biogenesis protein
MTWIKRYFRHELLPLLADLKLAIALLLLIALASATGTLIEQDEPLELYQRLYPEDPALFGFLSWRVIQWAGLDHVYRTPWFLSLLILFAASLTACTFTRQWPMLKVANRWNYYHKPRSFQKLALSSFLPEGDVKRLQTILNAKGYQCFVEDTTLYARKGLLGKVGPILVHASMLLILVGAIWGSISGFKAQEMIPSGSTQPIRNITMAGDLARSHLPTWEIQVNRFWIDYAPEGRIQQFYSDLSILDQGTEVKRQTISVNHPLSYQGVTLYQADWSIAAILARVNQSPTLRLPVAPLKTDNGAKLWGSFIPTKPDLSAGVTVLIPDLQGTVLIYGEAGELQTSMHTGSSVELNDQLTLYVDDLVGSTGLQIKSDPGIPWVYLGFGLLMVGVVMSYVSHSQVWALQAENGLFVGGKTNRALVSFEREYLLILEALSLSQKPSSSL